MKNCTVRVVSGVIQGERPLTARDTEYATRAKAHRAAIEARANLVAGTTRAVKNVPIRRFSRMYVVGP